jgi:DnaJ-class molecular chaperone
MFPGTTRARACVCLPHTHFTSVRAAAGGFDAEDILSQMFGGAMRGRAANSGVKRGAAIHTQINIPFMDAVNGTTRQVTVYANVRGAVTVL